MIGLPGISDRTISTGLVITRSSSGNQQYLLAVGHKDYWQPTAAGPHAPVFGIGGRPQPGETLIDCVIREAYEEGGFTIQLEDSCSTACISANPDHVTWVPVPDQLSPRPCFIWLDDIQQGSRHVAYAGVVFRAVLTSEPRATDDVSSLVWLPADLLPAAGDEVVTVRKVLRHGGHIINQLPLDLKLQLVGTARWLRFWLDCQRS